MNWQRIISFCCVIAVLLFSSIGLAKSNNRSIKPNVLSSKVKATVPSPAPPVLVSSSNTNEPTHKLSVLAGTPKSSASKVPVSKAKTSASKGPVSKAKTSIPKPAVVN